MNHKLTSKLTSIFRNVRASGLETVQTSKDKEFRETIYEIAFGEDAINRGFSDEDVIQELRRFSDEAYECEQVHEERESFKEDMD